MVIGHTLYHGIQLLHCWPFPELKYYGFSREDCVFVCPPGVECFVLSPNNVWYGRLKLLFSIRVIADDTSKEEPVDLDCALVSFFYDMNLELSGNMY